MLVSALDGPGTDPEAKERSNPKLVWDFDVKENNGKYIAKTPVHEVEFPEYFKDGISLMIGGESIVYGIERLDYETERKQWYTRNNLTEKYTLYTEGEEKQVYWADTKPSWMNASYGEWTLYDEVSLLPGRSKVLIQGTKVVYKDAFQGVDIIFEVQFTKVKETIVLNRDFDFCVSPLRIKSRVCSMDDIAFTGGLKNIISTGANAFEIESPYYVNDNKKGDYCTFEYDAVDKNTIDMITEISNSRIRNHNVNGVPIIIDPTLGSSLSGSILYEGLSNGTVKETIDGTVTYYEDQNNRIYAESDVDISGSLILDNITLKVNSSSGSIYTINVTDSGRFDILNASAVKNNNTGYGYNLRYLSGSRGTINNSLIENVSGEYEGLRTETSELNITNSLIRNSESHGVYCNASWPVIYGNSIYNCSGDGVYYQGQSVEMDLTDEENTTTNSNLNFTSEGIRVNGSGPDTGYLITDEIELPDDCLWEGIKITEENNITGLSYLASITDPNNNPIDGFTNISGLPEYIDISSINPVKFDTIGIFVNISHPESNNGNISILTIKTGFEPKRKIVDDLSNDRYISESSGISQSNGMIAPKYGSGYAFDIDTTADFDAGDKGSNESGNVSVETSTDNYNIDAGEIQLSNRYCDKFEYADSDGETWKWDQWTPTGSWSVHENDIDTTEDGEFYQSISSTDYQQNRFYLGGESEYVLSGDFDIRMAIELGYWVYGGSYGTRQKYAHFYLRDSGGTWAYISREVDNYCTDIFRWRTANTHQYIWNYHDKTCAMRFTRTGSTLKMYYRNDMNVESESWTLKATDSSWTSNDVYVFLRFYDNAMNNYNADVHWDDFWIKEGDLKEYGYCQYGNYTTENLTIESGQVLDYVRVDHENLDSENKINWVAFLNDTGSVVANYTNNGSGITSGNYTIISDNNLDEGNLSDINGTYRINVGLKGNKSSTPVITRLSGELDTVNESYFTTTEIESETYEQWDALLLNKSTSDVDNFITVSVLDGETNSTITGYSELSGSYIPLSGIDTYLHTSLKLRFDFITDGSNPPELYEWQLHKTPRWSYNYIYDCENGIRLNGSSPLISNNYIYKNSESGISIDNSYSSTLGRRMTYENVQLFGASPVEYDFDTSEGFAHMDDQTNSQSFWNSTTQSIDFISNTNDPAGSFERMQINLSTKLSPNSFWSLESEFHLTFRNNSEGAYGDMSVIPVLLNSTDDEYGRIYVHAYGGNDTINNNCDVISIYYQSSIGASNTTICQYYSDDTGNGSYDGDYFIRIWYHPWESTLYGQICNASKQSDVLASGSLVKPNILIENISAGVCAGQGSSSSNYYEGYVNEIKLYLGLPEIIESDDLNVTPYNASLNKVSETSGYLVTAPLTIDDYYTGVSLNLTTTEPANTSISVSILDAVTGDAIEGFENLYSNDIGLVNLTDDSNHGFKLRFDFQGANNSTPVLSKVLFRYYHYEKSGGVIDNVVYHNHDGIMVGNNSDFVSIVGNTIFDNTRYGIHMEGANRLFEYQGLNGYGLSDGINFDSSGSKESIISLPPRSGIYDMNFTVSGEKYIPYGPLGSDYYFQGTRTNSTVNMTLNGTINVTVPTNWTASYAVASYTNLTDNGVETNSSNVNLSCNHSGTNLQFDINSSVYFNSSVLNQTTDILAFNFTVNQTDIEGNLSVVLTFTLQKQTLWEQQEDGYDISVDLDPSKVNLSGLKLIIPIPNNGFVYANASVYNSTCEDPVDYSSNLSTDNKDSGYVVFDIGAIDEDDFTESWDYQHEMDTWSDSHHPTGWSTLTYTNANYITHDTEGDNDYLYSNEQTDWDDCGLQKWNIDLGEDYTIETRVNISSGGFCAFKYYDGSYSCGLSVSEGSFGIDTSQWHTYRKVANDGDYKFYIDGELDSSGSLSSDTSNSHEFWMAYTSLAGMVTGWIDYIKWRSDNEDAELTFDANLTYYLNNPSLSLGDVTLWSHTGEFNTTATPMNNTTAKESYIKSLNQALESDLTSNDLTLSVSAASAGYMNISNLGFHLVRRSYIGKNRIWGGEYGIYVNNSTSVLVDGNHVLNSEVSGIELANCSGRQRSLNSLRGGLSNGTYSFDDDSLTTGENWEMTVPDGSVITNMSFDLSGESYVPLYNLSESHEYTGSISSQYSGMLPANLSGYKPSNWNNITEMTLDASVDSLDYGDCLSLFGLDAVSDTTYTYLWNRSKDEMESSTVDYYRPAVADLVPTRGYRIGYIYSYNSTELNASIWNGSAWIDHVNLTANLTTNQKQCFALDFEYVSLDGVALWAEYNGTAEYLRWATYNSSGWDISNQTINVSNVRWITMSEVGTTGTFLALLQLSNGTVYSMTWNGSEWDNSSVTEISNSSVSTSYCGIALTEYNGNIIALYSETGGLRYRIYSNGWGSEQTVTGISSPYWVELVTNKDGTVCGAASTSSKDLYGLAFTGGSLKESRLLCEDGLHTTTSPCFDVVADSVGDFYFIWSRTDYFNFNITWYNGVYWINQSYWNNTYPDHEDTIGHWHFDTGYGSTVVDSSGYYYNGTIHNAEWDYSGRFHKGVFFNSTEGNNYVEFDDHVSTFDDYSQGILELWFKWNGTDTGGTLFFLGDKDTTNDYAALRVGSSTSNFNDESLGFVFFEGGTCKLGAYARKGETHYRDGQWHHVAWVVGEDFNYMFIDGKKETLSYDYGSSSTGNYFLNVNNADTMTLGLSNNSISHDFFGSIDEMRIIDDEFVKPLDAHWIEVVADTESDRMFLVATGDSYLIHSQYEDSEWTDTEKSSYYLYSPCDSSRSLDASFERINFPPTPFSAAMNVTHNNNTKTYTESSDTITYTYSDNLTCVNVSGADTYNFTVDSDLINVSSDILLTVDAINTTSANWTYVFDASSYNATNVTDGYSIEITLWAPVGVNVTNPQLKVYTPCTSYMEANVTVVGQNENLTSDYIDYSCKSDGYILLDLSGLSEIGWVWNYSANNITINVTLRFSPGELKLDIGGDGDNEWEYTGNDTFLVDASVNGFEPALLSEQNVHVSDDSVGYSYIPLEITSDYAGNVTISNLTVYYNISAVVRNNNVINTGNTMINAADSWSRIVSNIVASDNSSSTGIKNRESGTKGDSGSLIFDNIITNSGDYGININVTGTVMNGNTISNPDYGIYFDEASYNAVGDNIISNCTDYGIYHRDENRKEFGPEMYTEIFSNTISGCNMGLYMDSVNDTVYSNTFSGCDYGFSWYNSYVGNVTGNNFDNCSYGAYAYVVEDETTLLAGNDFSNCDVGLSMFGTGNATIRSNKFTSNTYGIRLRREFNSTKPYNVTVDYCDFEYNMYGVAASNVTFEINNCTFTSNTFKDVSLQSTKSSNMTDIETDLGDNAGIFMEVSANLSIQNNTLEIISAVESGDVDGDDDDDLVGLYRNTTRNDYGIVVWEWDNGDWDDPVYINYTLDEGDEFSSINIADFTEDEGEEILVILNKDADNSKAYIYSYVDRAIKYEFSDIGPDTEECIVYDYDLDGDNETAFIVEDSDQVWIFEEGGGSWNRIGTVDVISNPIYGDYGNINSSIPNYQELVIVGEYDDPIGKLSVIKYDGGFESEDYTFSKRVTEGVSVLDCDGDGTKEVVVTFAGEARIMSYDTGEWTVENSVDLPWDHKSRVERGDFNNDSIEDFMLGWREIVNNDMYIYTAYCYFWNDNADDYAIVNMEFNMTHSVAYDTEGGVSIGDPDNDDVPEVVIALEIEGDGENQDVLVYDLDYSQGFVNRTVRVQVYNDTNAPLEGVSVAVRDAEGAVRFSDTTGSDGLTGNHIVPLKEFRGDVSDYKIIYYSPFNVSVNDTTEYSLVRHCTVIPGTGIATIKMWLGEDTDQDGLTNGEENNSYLSNWSSEDTDQDGLSDGYEAGINASTCPRFYNSSTSRWEPTIIDTGRYAPSGRNATSVTSVDTDGDKLLDGNDIWLANITTSVYDAWIERHYVFDNDMFIGEEGEGTNPIDNDTDRGGVEDGIEYRSGQDPTTDTGERANDGDFDGLTRNDEDEYYRDPNDNDEDCDGDGLLDSEEEYGSRKGGEPGSYVTRSNDYDGDGISDDKEMCYVNGVRGAFFYEAEASYQRTCGISHSNSPMPKAIHIDPNPEANDAVIGTATSNLLCAWNIEYPEDCTGSGIDFNKNHDSLISSHNYRFVLRMRESYEQKDSKIRVVVRNFNVFGESLEIFNNSMTVNPNSRGYEWIPFPHTLNYYKSRSHEYTQVEFYDVSENDPVTIWGSCNLELDSIILIDASLQYWRTQSTQVTLPYCKDSDGDLIWDDDEVIEGNYWLPAEWYKTNYATDRIDERSVGYSVNRATNDNENPVLDIDNIDFNNAMYSIYCRGLNEKRCSYEEMDPNDYNYFKIKIQGVDKKYFYNYYSGGSLGPKGIYDSSNIIERKVYVTDDKVWGKTWYNPPARGKYTNNLHVYHCRQFKPDTSTNQRIIFYDYNDCGMKFDWISVIKNENVDDYLPSNPLSFDTDGDYIWDKVEIAYQETDMEINGDDWYDWYEGRNEVEGVDWYDDALWIDQSESGVLRAYHPLGEIDNDIYYDSEYNIDNKDVIYLNEYQYLSFDMSLDKEKKDDGSEPFSKLFLILGIFYTSKNSVEYKIINIDTECWPSSPQITYNWYYYSEKKVKIDLRDIGSVIYPEEQCKHNYYYPVRWITHMAFYAYSNDNCEKIYKISSIRFEKQLNPLSDDSDNDGIQDGYEIGCYDYSYSYFNWHYKPSGTSYKPKYDYEKSSGCLDPDTDNDALLDGMEAHRHLSLKDKDTDNDGLNDYYEYVAYGHYGFNGYYSYGRIPKGYSASLPYLQHHPHTNIPDIYIEMDWMRNCEPEDSDGNDVWDFVEIAMDIFYNRGIHLHVDNGCMGSGSQTSRKGTIEDASWGIKNEHFSREGMGIFYYGLICIELSGGYVGKGGGYKIAIASAKMDSTKEWAGVFLHELGHCVIRGWDDHCNNDPCAMQGSYSGVPDLTYCKKCTELIDPGKGI